MSFDATRLKRRLRSLLGNLLLLAAALTAFLLLAEGVLRLFGLAAPVTYRPDPNFGYEPAPNQSSFRLSVHIRINDVGLRDDEDLAALMKGTERILVIGNSVTYGGSLINQEDLWTEILERRLREVRPGVKVLNGGVVGYSVSQIMKRAPRLVQVTAPDYLILYLIRDDFSRPPVHFLAKGNLQEPLTRPRSALAAFLWLSLGHLEGRYRFRQHLPAFLNQLWRKKPPEFVPPYDQSKIIDIHFNAVSEFVRTVWEASGRDRSHIVAFISPARTDLMTDRPTPNADLVGRFESLGITAYDLQGDFHNIIARSGADVGSYYYDKNHYLKKGNQLAASAVYGHLPGELLKAR